MDHSWIEQIKRQLEQIRAKKPLVHNITNYVVMNTTANALLAVGASPVMAHAEEEVEEMAGMAGALVLNIGTLSNPWIRAMHLAAAAAKKKGIPIVLDPVGAGATALRTNTARLLMSTYKPAVVRGNASEILALTGESYHARGVDSRHTVDQARSAATHLALEHGITVAVTGAEDFVTDGRRSGRIRNGHPLMARITGTGCSASALTGAFCAVESDSFAAAIGALVVFGIAGQLAARTNPGPGTFQVQLLDALDEITGSHIEKMADADITPSAQ